MSKCVSFIPIRSHLLSNVRWYHKDIACGVSNGRNISMLLNTMSRTAFALDFICSPEEEWRSRHDREQDLPKISSIICSPSWHKSCPLFYFYLRLGMYRWSYHPASLRLHYKQRSFFKPYPILSWPIRLFPLNSKLCFTCLTNRFFVIFTYSVHFFPEPFAGSWINFCNRIQVALSRTSKMTTLFRSPIFSLPNIDKEMIWDLSSVDCDS